MCWNAFVPTRTVVNHRIDCARNLLTLFVSVAVCATAVGCGPSEDPANPAGGYNLFRKGLLQTDSELVWERLDQRSREYFQRRYDQLVSMDRKIEQYMPPTDHRLARKQSGTVLLEEIEGPKGLFERVIDLKNLKASRATELGSLVGGVKVQKDKQTAIIETRGGRTYRMVRQDDEWYVNLVDSVPAVDKSFEWLDKNREALAQTVNDRIEDEKERREEIIAQLFDVN